LAHGLRAAGVADEDVIIETKWQPFLRTSKNIGKSIYDRIHFLGGYSISNFMIHQPMSFSSPEAEMNAMADLVEAGKIKSVGVSNFNPKRMRRAHAALAKRGLPLALNQVHYSLIHRDIETDGTLETARELGISIVAYTPLGSGILTGKYHKNPALLDQKSGLRRIMFRRNIERTQPLITAMDEIAVKHNVTIAQVALNWVIHFNGEIVVTIPGATTVQQAHENAGAMNFVLSKDELVKLDDISRKLIK
jgi:aryl-alcohol dehydrogenase-like predicted oxidoreductase